MAKTMLQFYYDYYWNCYAVYGCAGRGDACISSQTDNIFSFWQRLLRYCAVLWMALHLKTTMLHTHTLRTYYIQIKIRVYMNAHRPNTNVC